MLLLLTELLEEGKLLSDKLDKINEKSIRDMYLKWLGKGEDIYRGIPHISNNVSLFYRDNNKVEEVTIEKHQKLLDNIKHWIDHYEGDDEVSFP